MIDGAGVRCRRVGIESSANNNKLKIYQNKTRLFKHQAYFNKYTSKDKDGLLPSNDNKEFACRGVQ